MRNSFLCIGLLCCSSVLHAASDYVVGQLVPQKSVVVSSEVPGIVDAYYYDNGDSVELGHSMVALSELDYELNLQLAQNELQVSQAELEIQEKQLKRYESLLKKKGVSASDVDNQIRVTNTSRAQYNVKKTQFKIAQRTWDKSTPSAPFRGVVTKRSVELGQLISSGDALFTISDLSILKVRFYLLEVDFSKFKKGENVQVHIPSLAKTLQGEVTLLSPAFQNQEPGFLVEVSVDNSTYELRPGMESYVFFNEEVTQ